MIEKGEILSSLLVFIVSKTGNWDCTIFHERYMFGKFSFDYIPTHKKKMLVLNYFSAHFLLSILLLSKQITSFRETLHFI